MRRGRLQLCRKIAAAVVVGGCCLYGSGAAYAIPIGRHYEMISPVFKGGFGATEIGGVSPSGESVAFYSAGIFEGAPSASFKINYMARRGADGWATTPLAMPASMSDYHFEDLSPDLSLELAVGSPTVHEYEQREEVDAWLRPTSLPDVPASWPSVSLVKSVGHDIALTYQTGSVDLCHAFLVHNNSERSANGAEPVAEAEGTIEEVYEIDRGCNGEKLSIRLVGLNNSGRLISSPECHVNVGNQQYGTTANSSANAVSADANVVFFTACTAAPPQHQLFARVGGSRTIEVSRPLAAGSFGGCVSESKEVPGEVPCKGAATRSSADFQGASEDGSRVYFIASLASGGSPLVPGDTDVSTNLYVATIGCPAAEPSCAASEREVTSLAEASHDPSGAAAEVQGVLRIAPNGQRAYFVAGGDLLSAAQQIALEDEGRSVPRVGAENLYVYDSLSGTVTFIADLCTGREQSGAAEEFRCPSGGSDKELWTKGGTDGGESQTGGPGGEFLVFSSYGQLTSEDTNAAKDVYRYDAVSGELTLVSHGEGGYDPNGSSGLMGAQILAGSRGGNVLEQHDAGTRAISEDGSRIVFRSAEPLSQGDTNGLVNAYEWHDGIVSLISTGSDQEPVKEVVISPDGSSVAFDTVQGLVAQDTDGLPDVYVARLGPGFPQPPAKRAPCEGDGCQGALTNPAPLLVPGSVSQAPGENVGSPAKVIPKKKPKKNVRSRCRPGYRLEKHGRCMKFAKARKAAGVHRRGHGSMGGGRS